MNLPRYDYDLFVLGAGSGGVRAARIAAGHGARVGIAEESRVGGTCVIRGCVPKKLLVYASRFRDEFEDAAGFGWSVGSTSFDWASLIVAKDREIARLEAAYISGLDKAGVMLHATRARLVDAHTVELIGEKRTITAAKILVATGGRPRPDRQLPGHELASCSDDMFGLPRLPAHALVVGGGYIAVEFACLLHGLGSQVTLVHRGTELLRGFDAELARELHEAMRVRGIHVKFGCRLTGIARDGGRLSCTLDDGTTLAADIVLSAIGRDPNTANLGLAEAGVLLGPSGQVLVDDYSRSSVENIFAVGDVTQRMALTPVAIREGHAFADTEFGGKNVKADHHMVPTAVFATPELGTVGLSEEAAVSSHRAVDIYRSHFRPLKATLSGRSERMLMKLIVDGDNQRVLGAHVLGPDAGEMAQLLAIPMRMGATKADFDTTMALHPSASEEWVTMSKAASSHRCSG